ncbi:POH2 hydrophobin [Mycena polygramma]|nr:POH2 hydrophobin [Mycena polygramma]
MFSKLSLVVSAVLITLAAAMPQCGGGGGGGGGGGSPLPPVTPPSSDQCCDSVQSSNSGAVMAVATLLGLDLTGLDVPVGLSCSPLTVVGDNCGGTTVTCDAPDGSWDGLIAINCIPITV